MQNQNQWENLNQIKQSNPEEYAKRRLEASPLRDFIAEDKNGIQTTETKETKETH